MRVFPERLDRVGRPTFDVDMRITMARAGSRLE